jgi:glycerol-3-phosphate dehydrogenase
LLRPHLPPAYGQPAGWTGSVSLPGGDFPVDGFEALLQAAGQRFPFLPAATLRRLLRAYGTNIAALLGNAGSRDDLGRVFGADLTEAELNYLARTEWARTGEDVLWRRSKLGLRLSPAEIAAVGEAMRRIGLQRMEAA